MSVEAISWALSVPLGGNLKVVLIGIANHAHEDGTNAYPSVRTLARYACCERSTVQRCLRRLEELEWIVPDGTGANGTNRYRLPLWRIERVETVGVSKCDPPLSGQTEIAQDAPESPAVAVGPTSGGGDIGHPPGGGSHFAAPAAPALPGGPHQRREGAAPVRPEPSRTIQEPSERMQRASAPPAFPRSAESAPSLVAWLEELAAFYGGRLVDAIAADRDGLVRILAGEQRAARLELLRWIQTQAPTWGAPNLAAALLANDRATILRARRDAAGRQAMQSRVAPDLPTFTHSRHLEPISARVARAVSMLPWGDEVELWVLPLAVVGATGHLITLAGPSGLVSGVRARLLPEIQRVLAPTVVELVAGDTTGCLPLSHFVNPESNAA